jgi:hypothetical protein
MFEKIVDKENSDFIVEPIQFKFYVQSCFWKANKGGDGAVLEMNTM